VPLEITCTLILKTFSSFLPIFFRKLTYHSCGFLVATTLVAMGTKCKKPQPEGRETHELDTDPSAFEPGTLLCSISWCFFTADDLYLDSSMQLNFALPLGFG
jgi:hypothetical protein